VKLGFISDSRETLKLTSPFGFIAQMWQALVSNFPLFAGLRVVGSTNCPNSLLPSVGTISFLLQTNPIVMNMEGAPQGPPDKQGERVEPGTFVQETPYVDKGKSTSFQSPLVGATSQAPETQMQRMAREIEALKRRNASLTRQLYPSSHGRVHIEGEEFSDEDDEETSLDKEEYGGEEGLHVESYHGGDRQGVGGSFLREEPITQEGRENVQVDDQRPPEGSGGDRVNYGQRRRRPQGGSRPEGGVGRCLSFEEGNRQNPRAGYY
jgi:hypothetical protein